MITGILAFLQALPEFLKLVNRVGDLLVRMNQLAAENDLHSWIDNLEASIDALEKAKTSDEKIKAAQRLVDSIRHL